MLCILLFFLHLSFADVILFVRYLFYNLPRKALKLVLTRNDSFQCELRKFTCPTSTMLYNVVLLATLTVHCRMRAYIPCDMRLLAFLRYILRKPTSLFTLLLTCFSMRDITTSMTVLFTVHSITHVEQAYCIH